MKRFVFSLLLALALAACTTAAEQKAADEKKCEGYGFKQGSDSFSKCMMVVDQNRTKMRNDDMNAMQMEESMMMAPGCAGACL
jgi:hypothetical protein